MTINTTEKKGERTTAVWQNGGFSAKFNGSSSIELLCKTELLCFDFRHFAKLQNVMHYLKRASSYLRISLLQVYSKSLNSKSSLSTTFFSTICFLIV